MFTAKLKGFKNHLWNGVTTDAFAKICLGIIKNDAWFNGLQHVEPKDIVTKAKMLHIFKDVFNRNDIEIEDINAKIAINRTIKTINPKKNEKLWQNAGYETIPNMIKLFGPTSTFYLKRI